MVSKILIDKNAAKAFENECNRQRSIFQDKESERQFQAQMRSIQQALANDPTTDPASVLAAAVKPREFLCQQTMERCLYRVITSVLSSDAVLNQEQFMDNTTKPKRLAAK